MSDANADASSAAAAEEQVPGPLLETAALAGGGWRAAGRTPSGERGQDMCVEAA